MVTVATTTQKNLRRITNEKDALIFIRLYSFWTLFPSRCSVSSFNFLYFPFESSYTFNSKLHICEKVSIHEKIKVTRRRKKICSQTTSQTESQETNQMITKRVSHEIVKNEVYTCTDIQDKKYHFL